MRIFDFLVLNRRFLFNVIPRLKFHNPDVTFQTKKGPKSLIQVQLREIPLVPSH